MEKYGKGDLTDAELGMIESSLDTAGFSGEYRQGYRDAMRDYLRALKSPDFARMAEDTIQSAIRRFGATKT